MIGIFDSGLGGLTVVKKFQEILPQYQLLYFGDTARTPYGNRGEEVIKQYAKQDAEILIKRGAQIIVVACNSASAIAYEYLRSELAMPVFEVVTPAAGKATSLTRNKRVGVIGTRATINSGVYEKLIKNNNKDIRIFQNSAPLLVPLVEEGWLNKPETKMILKKYLLPLKTQQIDTLIMACTHYPFLRQAIQEKIGRRVRLVDPAEEVVLKIKEYLEQNSVIDKGLPRNDHHQFLVSDLTSRGQNLASQWLGRNVKLEKIEI
jgi:glutamate racemase